MSQRSPEEIARSAKAVLDHEDFGRRVTETNWRWVSDPDSSWDGWDGWDFPFSIGDLGQGIARVFEVGLWIAAILIAAWLLRRILENLGPATEKTEAAPRTLFGMDITPESLPADVPAAAREAALAGDPRLALSLLYRGALSHLARGGDLDLGAARTDGECLRQVRGARPAPLSGWFEALVGHWQALAWGGRVPAAERVLALADDYRSHFP